MIDYLSLIANLATLGAALAAFVAIWEMRAQRRTTYVPRLAIDDTNLELRYGNKQGNKDENKQRNNDETQESNYSIFATALRVSNVGLGPARDVTATYYYDVANFVKLIRDIDTDKSVKFRTTSDRFDVGFISVESPAGQSGHNLAVHKPAIKVLMPKMGDSTAVWELPLPSHYMALLDAWAWICGNKLYGDNGDTSAWGPADELPVLGLELKYSDIANNAFRESYVIGFDLWAIQSHPDDRSSHVLSFFVTVKPD